MPGPDTQNDEIMAQLLLMEQRISDLQEQLEAVKEGQRDIRVDQEDDRRDLRVDGKHTDPDDIPDPTVAVSPSHVPGLLGLTAADGVLRTDQYDGPYDGSGGDADEGSILYEVSPPNNVPGFVKLSVNPKWGRLNEGGGPPSIPPPGDPGEPGTPGTITDPTWMKITYVVRCEYDNVNHKHVYYTRSAYVWASFVSNEEGPTMFVNGQLVPNDRYT